MNLEHYRFNWRSNSLEYLFESHGPRGLIVKIVRFTKVEENIFNLGMGDYDEETGDIDDLAVSDNLDQVKVFATVAAVVKFFFEKFPASVIMAKGSTPSRTRLYRIQLSTNLELLASNYLIFGLTDRMIWEPFKRNTEYEAFRIEQK